jgi:hypothetical protein
LGNLFGMGGIPVDEHDGELVAADTDEEIALAQ